MRVRYGSAGARSVPRLLVVCLLAGVSAACSSDTLRFADNPFQNPFQGSARFDPAATGSVAPRAPASQPSYQGAAPAGAVSSAPLPAPVSAAPLAPVSAATAPARAAAAPVMAATGTVARATPKGWTAQGGSLVTLGQGETVSTLSNRYGVPESAIRSVNGISGQPAPGTQLTIPVYHAVSSGGAPMAEQVAAAPAAAMSRAAPVVAAAPVATAPRAAQPTGKARMQLTQGPKSIAESRATQVAANAPEPARLVEPARATAKTAVEKKAEPARTIAKAEQPPARVAPATVAAVPAKAAPVVAPAKPAKVAAAPVAPVAPAKPVAVIPAAPAKVAAAPAAAAPVKVASAPAATPAKVAAAPAAAPAPKVAPAPVAEPAAAKVEPAETASIAPKGANTEFRWPARGRVISGFGKGGGNDGINISLPEGTPVKAAEGGEVAYAGNELKGYGNLVLVRHPDGWVSAYAHNGELKVKRGDKINRGQTLALSGQSGNVSSPQLHFELRKGSTPVDPMPHLAGN